MIVMVPGESSHGKTTHNATGFPEEVIQGIQALDIEFSAKLHTVGIVRFACHSDTGREFSIEFPGTLPIVIREFTTEFHDAKIKGEGAFSEGGHRCVPMC